MLYFIGPEFKDRDNTSFQILLHRSLKIKDLDITCSKTTWVNHGSTYSVLNKDYSCDPKFNDPDV